LSPFDGPQVDRENKSPNYSTGVARGVRKLLDGAAYQGEFHMSEWGLSWYPHRPERETPNEAAFIVKTMKEASQMCDYFAYWDLTDIYVEVGYGREAFHGNYGMISLDGLRKPSYFAHQLLCRLGHQKVPVENDGDRPSGAIVTKDGDRIKAIIYAFNIDYKAGDAPENKRVEFHLPNDLQAKTAQVYLVDAAHNNILRTWEEMGKPAHPRKSELTLLRSENELTKAGDVPVLEDRTSKRLVIEFKAPGVAYLEIG
jgi:xylan 1,4-beta-xylosidase